MINRLQMVYMIILNVVNILALRSFTIVIMISDEIFLRLRAYPKNWSSLLREVPMITIPNRLMVIARVELCVLMSRKPSIWEESLVLFLLI